MDIQNSIVALLNVENEIVGTGFVAADGLIVTCAHVLDLVKVAPGGFVRVRFAVDGSERFAEVDPSAYSPKAELDVAILRVSQLPKGVQPLRMLASAGCSGHQFFATGYPKLGDFEGLSARGEIISLEKDKRGDNYLQLRSQEVAQGMSGGPVLDTARNAVVGMVNSGFLLRADKKHRDTAFATPSETIWQVCPQLKPIISPLPRRNPIVEGIHLLPYDYDQRIQNFLTEYLGTDSHPVPFGGRDEALRMLDAWLAETTPYLLLAAPAGRGKSALLVRWLDSLKARDDLALAFVPVSIRFGTNMERVLYAALAARLAYLHGDDIPASPETSTAVYRGLVSDYLSKPLANGRTLLVVLDGLDEAADWQAGADFMPGELPAGVRVVVSARFLAGGAEASPWLRRLNWERNGLASAPSLTPLDRAGVADVLLKMGCPLDELSRNVDIVAELYGLSEGDPLLAGLYVGDLWAKGGAVTRLKPEDLAGIQPGYTGYVDRWWEDQKKLWGKDKPWLEKHVRAVRNLLAGALGPLFRDDFQAIEPELESDYIADALEVLQRFIIGDNQTQGYTFSHPKLGQYFWDALPLTEQAQVEGRFLAWGEGTFQEFIDDKRDLKKKAEVPTYIVHNYGAHLARAEQPIDKWLPLIHHQQWAQAWFMVEGAYGGYSQDVQRVWEQCRLIDRQVIEKTDKAPYIGQQIRCGLIESSLHNLAGNVPAKLAPILMQHGIWTLPQTWLFIRQMPEPQELFDAILACFPYLANDHLPEVLGAARAIQNEKSRARVLSALAQHLPDKALGQVVEVARAIQDEYPRAEALIALAQRLPEVIREAMEATRAIQDEYNRARVLSGLVQHLPDEALGQVLEMARVIQNEYPRAYVLSVLAQRLPEVAWEALAATRTIQDDESRAKVLSALAQRLPEVSNEALAAAQIIQNTWTRAEVLCALVQRLPEDALGQVLEMARVIQDEDPRAEVLCALAQRLPDVAREALGTVQAIENEFLCVRVVSDLAQHLPDEALGQVVEVARAIQDEYPRAEALIALAQRLPEVIREAMEATRAIQHEYNRARVLSRLVQHLPDEALGQVLEMARVIHDKRSCTKVLSALAQRVPEVAWEALVAAQTIQDDESRAYVLSALAQRLPEVSNEALAAAQIIQNEWTRTKVLCALAQRLPEDALGQALKAAQAIQVEWERAEMLQALVQRLPSEALGQVLEAARMIQDKDYRASLLSALAQRLPDVAWESLEAARAVQNKYSRARRLCALAQHLPEVAGEALEEVQTIQSERRRVPMLSELVQILPESMHGEILETTRETQDKVARIYLLSVLAQHFPESADEALEAARAVAIGYDSTHYDSWNANALKSLAQFLPERALGQILELAQAIQNEFYRADILSTLARHLPETMLEQVLEAARAIKDECNRASVLSDLAQHLPDEALEQVLEMARAIQNEEARAIVLSTLSQRLPQTTMETWEAAQAIQDEDRRASVLRALTQPLINSPVKKVYRDSEMTLSRLALRNRANLFSDLSALLPVFIHLGTNGLEVEILQAVRDVATWWP